MVKAGDIIRASDIAVKSCRANRTSAQSIPHATLTIVAFNSELFDTDGMHSTVTNNSRITIQTAGVYDVGFNGAFAAGSDYTRVRAILRMNGATDIVIGPIGASSSPVEQPVMVSTQYEFDVGDYIEVRVDHINGASAARDLVNVTDRSPHFWATRIGS